MNILIGLLSLVIGAFISFYVFNKKLLNSREENIQLKATLEEKEKSFAEKSKFVDQLKSQVNHDGSS